MKNVSTACWELEPKAAGWKAQKNSLSHGDPLWTDHSGSTTAHDEGLYWHKW